MTDLERIERITMHEIMLALNRFDSALRKAVRKDTMAEMAEEWAPAKLKACDLAWVEAKAARAELEAMIVELIVIKQAWKGEKDPTLEGSDA
jgi:hypothetical protein